MEAKVQQENTRCNVTTAGFGITLQSGRNEARTKVQAIGDL